MLGSLIFTVPLDRVMLGAVLGEPGFGIVEEGMLVRHPYLATSLICLEVLALLMVAAGFLFLAWRISWGVQQLVNTCRQRQKTEARLVDMFRDYVEIQRGTSEQFWSASTALSPC